MFHLLRGLFGTRRQRPRERTRWRNGRAPLTPPGPPDLQSAFSCFGLRPADRIAVMGLQTEVEQQVASAAAALGMTIVAIPEHSTRARLWIRMRGVSAAVVAPELTGQIARVAGDLTDLRYVWSWDSAGVDELRRAAAGELPVFAD